ncbi:MAG: substrate-binding domain-containing protein [Candidatus Hodarchaeaceae archaeon]|nr:substrate-binding domain-containing protein [Candidatus Hodarchaeaceae archaeon]
MKKITFVSIALVLCSIAAVGYVELWQRGKPKLKVATTTSLYDTGLLDFIGKYYEEEYNTKILLIPVGTGQAIYQAKMGEADVLLVHAPSAEFQFMEDNLGMVRKIIAYNFFAITGPLEDPVGIKDLPPIEALRKIAEAGRAGLTTWISRGDNSGTHIKEKDLWTAAGFDVSRLRREPWHIELGVGMGAALRMASEKRAYTLADVGTYLQYTNRGLIDLRVLVGQGKELLNVYSVMAVSQKTYPELNFEGAIAFIKFLVSAEGQAMIGDYGKDEYGQPLFYPAVKLLKENADAQIAGWIREYAFFENTECPPIYRGGHEELYG